MILAVDSSALALLINPAGNPPRDPSTEQPVLLCEERVKHFLAGLNASDTLIIPTPVLAEVLVKAGDGGPELMSRMGGRARIKIKDFGQRAAVETAFMTRLAIEAGDKREGSKEAWQKVKVDRQNIAIARVEGATKIYADDRGLISFARGLGMDVISTWDLPLPERSDDLFSLSGVATELASPEPASSVIGSLLQGTRPRWSTGRLDIGTNLPALTSSTRSKGNGFPSVELKSDDDGRGLKDKKKAP